MNPSFLIPVPILATLWFGARHYLNLKLQDGILKSLYTDHHEIWKQLGEPSGWQWSPPGKFFPSGSHFHCFDMEDPEWLVQAPELKESFYRLRKGIREFSFIGMPIIVATWILFFVIVGMLQKSAVQNV
ncbi:MAG: hypothetical protein JWQ71_2713 [Pedosphaera sp.]|nr:hypothetical protein [Pedosphaera sp.]